ncbi:TlpA disulfide reductase family protein [Hydrogenovibrio sp. 3SP14C1]|uniref:TlpA disulfide reductase family protein n=1 Tax=Hydrogenovibrio sp. 3SP14C1 TaxID=3038774 RepID=UPI002417339C|nr:TlpA disulfide reductase family protein [Hydrogenovibrio sp. 3SP14C1]MDG4811479.1 TlpA disulfide reductase family protein [Hydrogenovibrio sp. 3SP14C1]
MLNHKMHIGLMLVWFCINAFHAAIAEIPHEHTLEGALESEVYPATTPIANVLWVPSEHGVLKQEQMVAEELADSGFTVTMPNLFESYFLPVASSSLRKIPSNIIEREIARLHASELPLFVISSNEGAALVIKALASFQQTSTSMVGLVLLNPSLYIETPQAGQKAKYWPTVSQVNAPVYIIQSELSPWRWHLPQLQQQLSLSGSDVFIRLLPKVRDRYYFRPDALPVEQTQAQRLASDLMQAMKTLAPYLPVFRESALAQNEHSEKMINGAAMTKPRAQSTDKTGLQPYSGSQQRYLKLNDMNGQSHSLDAYQGKVVLLNFWASWCPPCVHEIPSMTRLKTVLKDQPFEILAANLAEEKPAIQDFLKQHPVNFPILLDPKGSAVQAWQVFAYPSSYVIDGHGKIRYALFGGHEWDDPLTIQKIQSLIEKTTASD